MSLFSRNFIMLQLFSIFAVLILSNADRSFNSWLPTRQRTLGSVPNPLTLWGCTLPNVRMGLNVRGGYDDDSNSPPEDDEEEEDDNAEEDDEDEEAADEEPISSTADIEIKVPEEEEWNDNERAIEEAEADIEVMVEMEAEESEESDMNNKEPEVLEPAIVKPVVVESTLDAECATPIDDGDSSAFVDRMELADAYDEGDSTTFENEGSAADRPPTVVSELNSEPSSESEPQPEISASTEQSETTATAEEEPATSVAEPETVAGTSEPPEEPQVSSESAPSTEQQPTDVVAEEQPAPTSASTPADVTETITDAMKKSLAQLGYRRDDIARMKPSIAAVAIDKKLNRPIEGLPENWYLPGKMPRSGNQLAKVIVNVLLPILAAAVAVKGGMELDLVSLISPSSSSSNADSVETFRPLTAADMAYYSSIISEATGKKTSPKRQ